MVVSVRILPLLLEFWGCQLIPINLVVLIHGLEVRVAQRRGNEIRFDLLSAVVTCEALKDSSVVVRLGCQAVVFENTRAVCLRTIVVPGLKHLKPYLRVFETLNDDVVRCLLICCHVRWLKNGVNGRFGTNIASAQRDDSVIFGHTARSWCDFSRNEVNLC